MQRETLWEDLVPLVFYPQKSLPFIPFLGFVVLNRAHLRMNGPGEAILLQQPPSWPSEGVFSVDHRHSRHDFVQTLHQCPLPSPAGNQPRQLHLTPLPRHQG